MRGSANRPEVARIRKGSQLTGALGGPCRPRQGVLVPATAVPTWEPLGGRPAASRTATACVPPTHRPDKLPGGLLSLLWTASMRDRREGAAVTPPFLSSPLFDPRRRRGVEWSGRPSSRRLQAATAHSGEQGRRRLAPGPQPRAATHSARLGASMASTARTHPLLAASTVASTQASYSNIRSYPQDEVIHSAKFNFS